MLGKTNEPIPESECPYEIALVVSKDALQEGKSGILFKSYGDVDLFPSLPDQELRSEAEKNNHRLFDDLSSASVGGVFHPLVARGVAETAALMGKAIASRRIATGLFS